jgi:hypothetical protein
VRAPFDHLYQAWVVLRHPTEAKDAPGSPTFISGEAPARGSRKSPGRPRSDLRFFGVFGGMRWSTVAASLGFNNQAAEKCADAWNEDTNVLGVLSVPLVKGTYIEPVSNRCQCSLLTLIQHPLARVPPQMTGIPSDCCQPGRRLATKLRSLGSRLRLSSAKGTP